MAGNDTNVYSTFLAKRVDVDAKKKWKDLYGILVIQFPYP